eukprot:scaffold5157_cov34-Attheya_sp.AAC.4
MRQNTSLTLPRIARCLESLTAASNRSLLPRIAHCHHLSLTATNRALPPVTPLSPADCLQLLPLPSLQSRLTLPRIARCLESLAAAKNRLLPPTIAHCHHLSLTATNRALPPVTPLSPDCLQLLPFKAIVALAAVADPLVLLLLFSK